MSMIGKTLGKFECTALLGKGGMGEVYKAKDQKLGRDVAIKVLPEEFAKDTDRVVRFQREAKLLASLNHPNIAAIYGLEESDGSHFLVLELIEGDTLADRLKKGAIPVEESLKLALQIAEALEAAHEKGVIHRDLKPANIKVTPDGKVKVLDFGLAKAFAGEQGEMILSDSPTLSVAATQQGVILGTAAYMSPEQSRGREVDKRSDVWAFGVVLFEMLTGKQVFSGDTVSDTLASVLARDPEWERLPANLHPRIRLLFERCLKKEPKDRYGAISDARVDIQEVLADPNGILAATVVEMESISKPRKIMLWILFAALICATTLGITFWIFDPSSEFKSVSKLSVVLPYGELLKTPVHPSLALSPDGKKLAFILERGGIRQIYLRNLDSYETKPIAGTENSDYLFFSPDGQWLGFIADRKLMKVNTESGGVPLTITDAPFPTCGASWGEDGKILLSPGWGEVGLVQVSSDLGGKPIPVTSPNQEYHRWPQILPGDAAVIFTIARAQEKDSQILVQSMITGEQNVLINGGVHGKYVPTGHLVYLQQGNLMAVHFDLDRLETRGTHVSILDGITHLMGQGGQYSFSNTGSLVYVKGGIGTAEELVWINRHSLKEERLEVPSHDYAEIQLSPDDKQIALTTITQLKRDVLIYDISNNLRPNPLTSVGSNDLAIWTPDGKHITFRSDQGKTGLTTLFEMPADGSRNPELLLENEYNAIPCSWSPDGKNLAFTVYDKTQWHIYIFPSDKKQAYPLFNTRFKEYWPSFSPDGKWIAYETDETGQDEIHVRPFPESGEGRRQVSIGGGTYPIWAGNGELFYMNGNKIMAVEVKTSPTFRAGIPKIIYEGNFSNELGYKYDVTSDGNRLLILRPYEQEETPPQLNVILNWFEELKERVPVD